jgi:hypothetical protein
MTSIKLACIALVAALLAVVTAPQVQASGLTFAYVSSTGLDSNPCTATSPCASIFQAIVSLTNFGGDGQVSCVNAPSVIEGNSLLGGSFTLDCPGVITQNNGSSNSIFQFYVANQVVRIRNLTFSGVQATNGAIQITGNGTLILENCVFENIANGPALQITPNGAFNLVVTNTRFSGNSSGVLIQPASGGSVKAAFDRVTVTQNSGGGVKIDSVNGPVTLDVTASEISYNNGNGVNVVSGGGGAAMVSIGHSVISENGAAGVQANGANAAALIDTTLLDSNASGATSVVGSAHALSYGTNRIVGSAGSGFTGPASLQ